MTDDRTDLLDEAERFLREAVHAQQADTDPDHGDFYAWGWLLTTLAEHTAAAARVLAGQVAGYGVEHRLYDDEAMPTGQRIDRITEVLDDLAGHAALLRAAAARYHSEVGHLGVVFGGEEGSS